MQENPQVGKTATAEEGVLVEIFWAWALGVLDDGTAKDLSKK